MSDEVNEDGQRRKKRRFAWLKSPLFWTIVLGTATILAAYNIFYLQREIRSLEAVILSDTSLIEIAENFKADIEIRYRGEPITENFSLLQVKLENTGNRNLRPEDYAQPIKFVFSTQTEVVSATVIESNPANINPVLNVEQNLVIIEPVLLNTGNRFIIQLLVANIPVDSVDPFEIKARLVGIDEIPLARAIDDARREVVVWGGLVLSLIAGFSIGGIVSLYINWLRSRWENAFMARLEKQLQDPKLYGTSSRESIKDLD